MENLQMADSTETSKRMEQRQENMAIPEGRGSPKESSMIIVDPDDPILSRFQEQLKNFYLARLEEMNQEMKELEKIHEGKLNDQKNLENEIHKKQILVSKYRKDLENVDVLCHNIKTEIEKAKQAHNEVLESYQDACEEMEKERKAEERLQKERQNISMQVIKLRHLQEASSADSSTLKCVARKVEIEKNLLETETFQLDLVINRLKDQLALERRKVEVFKAQCTAQEEETVDMRKFLAETEGELSAIRIANQQLMGAWKSTLEILTDRRFCISNLEEAIRKQNGALLLANAELNNLKRNNIKEQLEINEQLVLKLKQIRASHNRAYQQVDKLTKRLDEVLDQSAFMQQSITELDKQYNIVNREAHEIYRVAGDMRGEIQKAYGLCQGMEREIMKITEENKYRNSAMKVVHEKIRYWKKKIEEQQKANVEIENEASNVLLKVQNARINIPVLQASKDELIKTVRENEEEQSGTEEEMQRRGHIMSSKRRKIIILKRELGELISQAGGLELTPAEREIEHLKKEISDIKEEEARVEMDCKKRQLEMICLSNELDELYRELDSYSKEIEALEETNKRMDAQIDREKRELMEKDQNIQSIKRDIEHFYAMVRERESKREDLRSETIIAESEWLCEIKKLQVDILKLEESLDEIKKSYMELEREVKDKEYESVFWDRKLQMAEETRAVVTSSIHKEEMEKMTQTNHFLKRQYEEFEREREFLEIDLRKTLDTYGNLACRQDLKRKLATKKQSDKLYLQEQHVRRELVSLKSAIKTAEKEIESLNNEKAELQRIEDSLKEKIQSLRKGIIETEEEIKECERKKNQNMILINMKQHLSTLYQNIRDRKFQGTAKSLAEIQIRVDNLRRDFAEIRNICEMLHKEFPPIRKKLDMIVDMIEVSKML